MDEELEDILKNDGDASNQEQEADPNEGFLDRNKKKLAVFLKKHAFLTVLCMASVSTAIFALRISFKLQKAIKDGVVKSRSAIIAAWRSLS